MASRTGLILPHDAAGTAQYPFAPVFSEGQFCTYNTAAAADSVYVGPFSHETVMGWHDIDSGLFLIGGLPPGDNLLFKFFGSDAENETFGVKLWPIHELAGKTSRDKAVGAIGGPAGRRGDHCEYIGGRAVSATITLGAATINTQSLILPDLLGFWADTITVTSDETLTPGVEVIEDGADGAAMMKFDFHGAPYVLGEMTRSGFTGAGMGALWRVL